jgi:lipid-A-disaccharide synthase-like uncharacterized protein
MEGYTSSLPPLWYIFISLLWIAYLLQWMVTEQYSPVLILCNGAQLCLSSASIWMFVTRQPRS